MILTACRTHSTSQSSSRWHRAFIHGTLWYLLAVGFCGMQDIAQTTWLEVGSEDGAWRCPLFAGNPCRIGRAETSTIVLTDDKVSRNHAMIQSIDAGSYVLFDLGSVNGTSVEGRRISVPTVLKDRDRIMIGRTELRFHRENSTAWETLHPDAPGLGTTTAFYAEELITVLVIDVRGYTHLAQTMKPDTLSQVMRAFFSFGSKALLESGSWAQKYIGDAIMAVWIHKLSGARTSHEVLSIVKALLCVVDVAGDLQERFGLAEPIRVGAGLNTGRASVGNVGGIAAADYTAVGDVVNKAFRLESATKQTPYDLLLGRDTFTLLGSQLPVDALFSECIVDLKGYEKPAPAWGTGFGALARALGTGAVSRAAES